MTELLTNQLVEIKSEGVIFRVLWVDPLGRGYYVIDVGSQAAFPEFRGALELEELLAHDEAALFPDDQWLAPLMDAGLPDSHKERRDRAWDLIQPLALNLPDIFKPRVRGEAVAALVDAGKATKQTVYRLLRRYWQRGMVPNALLPDYTRSGARGREKSISPHRRRSGAEGNTFSAVIDADTRQLFLSSIMAYKRNKQLDLRECHERIVKDHYSERVLNERTGRFEYVARPPYPTLRQFRYWYEKDNDIFHNERIRRTPRVYDKDMRAILGSSTAETVGPGFRYQIDATIGDVYLVSRFDPNKIVGRPVVYIVIDVFSRMITGLYIGLEGPSWVGAMMALANAAEPKVEYCRRFGIEIEDADWPCDAMPDRLLGDRGEMAGAMVETLIKTLWVNVENAAPYRADWKGIVEQRFNMIPAKFKAYVPGYVAPDFGERGARDYRLDGKLNLADFTEIFIRCVLYYNNHHVLKDYRRIPEMIADEAPPVPIELWHWGIVNRSGFLRSFPSETVRLALMPSDEATVTAKGIRFWGCFYSCAKALEEHWFERARQRGNWKVRVSYDPRLMDDIYLQEEGERVRFIPCALTDASADYRGKSLWEIDQLRKEDRRQVAASHPNQLSGQFSLNDAIQEVIDRAEKKTETARACNTESDSQRTKGVRKNRAAEKAANRPEEAFRFAKPEQPSATVLPFPGNRADDTSEPDITEILRSLGEDGDDDK